MEFPKTIDNGLFTVGKEIGKGSFGHVFNATKRNGTPIAIKFERVDAKQKCLEKEIEVSKI